MHLLLMYISHLFNYLAFILQDDYITRLFYSKHLLCFFIYFSSRFSTRNIWYVNLYILLRCYKNFGMEISIWLSYYTKKINQILFSDWFLYRLFILVRTDTPLVRFVDRYAKNCTIYLSFYKIQFTIINLT